jgi:hypothetical protein
MHAIMMIVGGTAILLMEATGDYVGSRAAADDAGDGEGGGEGLSVDGVLETVFAAVAQFLWNGPKHAPQTVGGKVALFALSFHTLVIGASYTASLTGILSTSYKEPVVVLAFSSIKKSPLTSITGKLCVLQSAQVRWEAGGEGDMRSGKDT